MTPTTIKINTEHFKPLKWYHWLFRALRRPTCCKCTNIAQRTERGLYWYNVCLNHLLDKSDISIPLTGYADGWDYDPAYSSPLQRLWIKLKWKEKGKPTRIK